MPRDVLPHPAAALARRLRALLEARLANAKRLVTMHPEELARHDGRVRENAYRQALDDLERAVADEIADPIPPF